MFAFVHRAEHATTRTASDVLEALITVVLHEIHMVLTDNGIQFADIPKNRNGPTAVPGPSFRPSMLAARYRASADQAQAPLDKWPGRADEPDDQGGNRQTLSLRQPRSAPQPHWRFRLGIQFRPTAQDPSRPHTTCIHLRRLDKRARKIQARSNQANAGTKHLGLHFPVFHDKRIAACEAVGGDFLSHELIKGVIAV